MVSDNGDEEVDQLMDHFNRASVYAGVDVNQIAYELTSHRKMSAPDLGKHVLTFWHW